MLARMVLLTAFVLPGSRAEIIDRVAVTLDNQVITESEILWEIRLTAFLNGDPLDFTPEARKKAAGRLIEQKLIRKEIALGHYVELKPEEAEAAEKQMQSERFRNPGEYRQALEKYGVAEADLQAHLLWQVTLLHFIDLRFRPGVQVTDEEIRAYFEKELAEQQKSSGPGKPASFEDVRDKIQEILTNQRVDKQMDDWLAETRKRTHIEFRPEAFQ